MANSREQELNEKLDYLYNTKNIIKDVLVTQGVEVSEEDTFREYADKIKSLGKRDVLLFESVDDMYAYEAPKEGILALIYKSQIENTTNIDTGVQYIIFPKEVTLPQECTTYIRGSIRDTEGYSIGEVLLNSSQYTFTIINTKTGEFIHRIEYTSTDGINYTRTTDIAQPVDMQKLVYIYTYNTTYQIMLAQFTKYETGTFIGLYKYTEGSFIAVKNQFNLTKPNQLLTDYSAFGATTEVIGDGSYISNIKANEYINQYLPNIKNNSFRVEVIQSGAKVKALSFVQRQQISASSAFSNTLPVTDSIIQAVEYTTLTKNITAEHKSIIQGYLNANRKDNHIVSIGNKEYQLYLGYNYTTTTVVDTDGVSYTKPSKITELFAFMVDLDDLSIYKTFQNIDIWSFTQKNFGDVLAYTYSEKEDCLLLITNLGSWGYTDGAYLGLTKISATTGSRTTKYYTVNYTGDYSFKKVNNVSYNKKLDCFYLAYCTFQSSSQGGKSTVKRIIKLNSDGEISSLYQSDVDMQVTYIFWNDDLRDTGSLVCYNNNDTTYIRNLETSKEVVLYGSKITSLRFYGFYDEYLLVNTKLQPDDDKYVFCKIDKDTLDISTIGNFTSDSRQEGIYFKFNNKLCIFYNRMIISVDGDILGYFRLDIATLSNASYSGLTKIDDYSYKSTYCDYNVSVSADNVTGKQKEFLYFEYSTISSFPVINELCMISPSITSEVTNDKHEFYMYDSLVLTDIGRNNTHLLDEITRLQTELDNANNITDIIRGE